MTSGARVFQADAETAHAAAAIVSALLQEAIRDATNPIDALSGASATLPAATIIAAILAITIGDAAGPLIALNIRRASTAVANRFSATIELGAKCWTRDELNSVDEYHRVIDGITGIRELYVQGDSGAFPCN